MWPTGALKFLKNYFTTPLKFSKLPNFFHSHTFKPLQHYQATTFPLSLVERFKDFLFPGSDWNCICFSSQVLISSTNMRLAVRWQRYQHWVFTPISGVAFLEASVISRSLLKVWQMIVCSEDQKVIFIHNMRRRRVRLRGVIWDLRKYISTTK